MVAVVGTAMWWHRTGYRSRASQPAGCDRPADLVGRRTVTCDERDIDRYGRIVGRCLVGGLDVDEWLVAQGLALTYRQYSHD